MTDNRQEKERHFWDAFANRYNSFMKYLKPAYTILIEYIKEELKPNFVILEVATGTGIIALEMASDVKRVYGIDISPEMINIATEKAFDRGIKNVEFSVQDAYKLNFKPNSFDVVITSNVLHVMIQPVRALSAIHYILKNEGILIAPTYCHGESIISKTISSIMSLFGYKSFYRWSIESFKNFIEENDYKIVKDIEIKGKIPLLFLVAKKK